MRVARRAGTHGALPRVLASIAAIAAIGCGRIGFESLTRDGPLPSEPVRIDELSLPDADDDDPTLTADLLEIYFNSTRSGVLDLYWSTRATIDAPWSPPLPVVELNTGLRESNPNVSSDGLELYFGRTDGSQRFTLFRAIRATRGDLWDPPVAVAELDLPGSEIDFTTDETSTIGVLENGAGSTFRLYLTTRASRVSPWGAPGPEPLDLGPTTSDASPFLSSDGMRLYFDRVAAGGTTTSDLHVADRVEGEWIVAPLAPFNTPANDSDPWVDPGGRFIAFSSDRAAQAGLNDLFWGTLP